MVSRRKGLSQGRASTQLVWKLDNAQEGTRGSHTTCAFGERTCVSGFGSSRDPKSRYNSVS
jgi:hypothetical protein